MNLMGKKELYRFSLGFYFYYMGGEPLDRSGGLNKVDSIAAIFQRKETFRLAVLFEGTEKNRCIKNRFLFYCIKSKFPYNSRYF